MSDEMRSYPRKIVKYSYEIIFNNKNLVEEDEIFIERKSNLSHEEYRDLVAKKIEDSILRKFEGKFLYTEFAKDAENKIKVNYKIIDEIDVNFDLRFDM